RTVFLDCLPVKDSLGGRGAHVKIGIGPDDGRNTGKQLAAESFRFRAQFLPGFLHVSVDVWKQVAELLPLLSPGLDSVVLRQQAGQVLAQSPFDGVAEGQPQDSWGGL